MHVAQRFERLLDAYKKPDGSRCTEQQLDEAAGGVVRRSYVTNLRKGASRTLATAMGFPPALWSEDVPGDGARAAHTEDQGLAAMVGRLFAAIRHPRTDEPTRTPRLPA